MDQENSETSWAGPYSGRLACPAASSTLANVAHTAITMPSGAAAVGNLVAQHEFAALWRFGERA